VRLVANNRADDVRIADLLVLQRDACRSYRRSVWTVKV